MTFKDAARSVVMRTGGAVRDEAINVGLVWLLGALASAVPAVVLTMTSGARTFAGWLALTWPLTIAAAMITVLGMRVVRGPGLVLGAAGILFVAMWLGTTLVGSPLMMSRMPEVGTAGLGLVFGFLGRFHQVYGTGAFAMSLACGVLIGALAAQKVPDQTS